MKYSMEGTKNLRRKSLAMSKNSPQPNTSKKLFSKRSPTFKKTKSKAKKTNCTTCISSK